MKKLFRLFIVGMIILTCLKNSFVETNCSENQEGNTLTLNAKISENCKEYVDLAGKQYYSMASAEYAVKNSAGETVGIFVTDENGVGHVKGTDSTVMTNLSDGEYLIELIKQPENKAVICNIGYDDKKYVTLKSHTPTPTIIEVNTATDLYGKNNSGNYFSNNQYKLWSTSYGTGIFECGIAEVDSPCQIADFGRHQLDVSTATVLERDGKTAAGYSNELIYKIMYYGRSGPNQWSGFSNSKYSKPFMSRNGKNQYTAGYGSSEALAAFITHVALSRAWGRDNGKWALQAPIAGFYDFWNYVMNAEKAPSNFVVYVWQHSQIHKNEQDMFFGYTLEKTDYDHQNVQMDLVTDYDPVNAVLRKSSTDDQRVAGAQFTIKYYNEYVTDVLAAEQLTPSRIWTFETDYRGLFWYDESFKVGGDELFYCARRKMNPMIPGTYVVSETLVPEGYVKADDFIIRSDNRIGISISFYAADGVTEITRDQYCGYELTEYREGYLNLIKKSTAEMSNIPVGGAVYNVYTDKDCTICAKINNSDDLAILKTNEDGLSNTVALAPGKYYIKEEVAPKGYWLDDKVYEVDIKEKETVQKQMFDEEILYKVEKVDIEGNSVENATIELYEGNTLLTSFVTGKQPTDISKYLRQGGTYRLHESGVPNGYLQCDDICFTVDTVQGELVIISMLDNYCPLIQTRAYYEGGGKYSKKGNVNIIDEVLLDKLIVGNKYQLIGQIYNKNNPDICLVENKIEFNADSDKEKINLNFKLDVSEDNTYIVFESLYDENGNLLAEHSDINDVDQTIYCPSTIMLTVIKTDVHDKQKYLSGCEITIYNQDNEIIKDIYGNSAVKITDMDGKAIFELFDIEENIYVQETKAPAGYRINNKKFAVEKNKRNIIIEIDDAKVADTGDVDIVVPSVMFILSFIFLGLFVYKKRNR